MRTSHRKGSSEDLELVAWVLAGERHSLERVHAQGHIHARAIGQEGSEGCLLKQPEDQDLVPGGTGRAGAGEPAPAPPPHRDRGRWRDTETETKRDKGEDRSGRWRHPGIKPERNSGRHTGRKAYTEVEQIWRGTQ